MGIKQKILIIVLAVIFLSSLSLPHLQASAGSCSDRERPSFAHIPDHGDDKNSTDSHRTTPCSPDHSCCQMVANGTTSYCFILDGSFIKTAEIFSRPQVITRPFYHPPQYTC